MYTITSKFPLLLPRHSHIPTLQTNTNYKSMDILAELNCTATCHYDLDRGTKSLLISTQLFLRARSNFKLLLKVTRKAAAEKMSASSLGDDWLYMTWNILVLLKKVYGMSRTCKTKMYAREKWQKQCSRVWQKDSICIFSVFREWAHCLVNKHLKEYMVQ